MKKYFSCHNHTDYSNIRGLDAIDKVEQLIAYALNLGLSGIAITDHETLSSHVKAMQYMSSLKDKAKKTLENNSNDTRAQAILDFKLAYGNEIYLCRDNLNSSNYVKGEDGFWHFILIAKDKVGHQQLRELSSRAWTHYFKQFAERVPTYYSDVEEIAGTNPGHLIASTACLGSQFDKMILKGEFDKALNFVNWCQSIFGKENFFIEFQPGLTDEQISYNKSALDFCSKHNLTTIVTTDTHYLKAEDRPIHKAFLNSNDSEREVDSFYSHTYMMDEEEILNLMGYLGIDNVKSMLNNTLNIYDKVEEYSLAHKQLIPRIPISWDNVFPVSIPDYPYIQKFVKSPYEEDRLYVTRIFNGLSKKNIWDEKHIERIEIELEQIWKISEKEQERLSNYFLTMSKIIDIIWESNSIVGPGRGSVFTHLCSYCLDIIQEDPLISPIPLPWWRFLSEERPEYPDIDTDFEASKRNKVIANIKKYFQSIGGDLVPVCTFGTETSKSALKTACRGLGYEPELGSFFSSLVPIDRGFVRSLSQCYSGDEEKGYKAIPQFINEMDKYPDVWEVARKIEGLISQRGRHACLSGESKISTKNGYKNLKDVQIGDLVLTNDGTYQKVLDSFSSGIKDVFELRATNNFPILATSNHPFLIRSKISIDKIEGRKFGLTKPTWKTISEIVPVEDFIGQRVNTESIIPSLTYKMPYNEKDFWWIIGRYVGGGWTEEKKHHEGESIEKCCIICCNKKNQETYKVCSYLDKINFQYRVEEVKTTNKIYIKKEDLYDFLMEFKEYADCKIIPNFVQDLPIHLAESFLKGYFSADGYKRKETQTFKTVSYSLALGISELVKKVYRTPVSVSIIKPQIEIIEGRKVNSKQKYDCSFTINPKGTTRYVVDGNYIWSPVKSITAKNRIETFNLTVDVNNTYLANNIIVHNCGVLPVNQAFSDYNALMRAPDGGFTSQWELHDSEWMGLLKYDYLTTDFLDREHCCLDLLCDYGYCERGNTLRETYNRYLYPNKLDYKTKDMWELAINNKVASLFQFDTNVGLTTIKKVKPHSLGELAQSNSLMRLMPEGNKETPTEEYIKYKENIDIFNREIDRLRATDKEKNALKEILLPLYGVADGQEAVMSLLMHKDLFDFSIKEAHSARKLIAKKQIKKIEEYRENLFKIAEEKGISFDVAHYIWDVQVSRQLGYAFSYPHTVAYSIVAVQALNLSYHYPIIFWNTACLIVDSDGMEDEEEVEEDEEEIIDEDALIDEPEEKVKKKVKPVKYDKISSAIGKMKQAGVAIKPPDINKSTFTFVPDIDNNQIIYGIKGITRVNNDYANEVIANRPYSSFEDFLSRVKSTKLQIINLIKSGAFDNISNQTREELMNQYAISISDCKKKLTLQNMPALVARNLIPEEYDRVKKVFNFNKFLKKNKFEEYYCLDQYSQDFFSDNFNADLLEFEDGKCVLLQKTWDKIYKKEMDVIRPYLAEPSTLEKLNKSLIEDQLGKYCEGTTSKWEMDSIGFYNGAHELDGINLKQYDIIDYFDLPEDPVVTKVLNFEGKQVPIFEISRIAGTILGKDKLKNVVTILTKEGVVKVKIYKPQFVKYDKQIFTKDEETGKKKIIERSWFTRGNKIIFTGIKRGDNFVPKKYKGTPYPVIELVTEIDYKNNRLKTISERNDA